MRLKAAEFLFAGDELRSKLNAPGLKLEAFALKLHAFSQVLKPVSLEIKVRRPRLRAFSLELSPISPQLNAVSLGMNPLSLALNALSLGVKVHDFEGNAFRFERNAFTRRIWVKKREIEEKTHGRSSVSWGRRPGCPRGRRVSVWWGERPREPVFADGAAGHLAGSRADPTANRCLPGELGYAESG